MVVVSVAQRLEQLIVQFSTHITEVGQEIAAVWASAAARLQTITGIGLLTTAMILTTTLNSRCVIVRNAQPAMLA